MSKIILGVMLKQRMETSVKFQELISEYGCNISTRIGLHVAGEESCSPSGIVILEIADGCDKEAAELKSKLEDMGLNVQKMVF